MLSFVLFFGLFSLFIAIKRNGFLIQSYNCENHLYQISALNNQ